MKDDFQGFAPVGVGEGIDGWEDYGDEYDGI